MEQPLWEVFDPIPRHLRVFNADSSVPQNRQGVNTRGAAGALTEKNLSPFDFNLEHGTTVAEQSLLRCFFVHLSFSFLILFITTPSLCSRSPFSGFAHFINGLFGTVASADEASDRAACSRQE
ncbi:hypothetical protein SKAU_G00153230 [Synaphobranchus kaupii]|uniref:Uncharacterized protein n=1 Tax=Synaphobranchus kaupii TaxID=118154 RepID=A0A9Q1FH74_SYNKA|nr:hypothetical protein SKAU_G00153230 [Synaphobranchus kaupii]